MSAPRTITIALTQRQAQWLASEMAAFTSHYITAYRRARDIVRQIAEQTAPGSMRQAETFRKTGKRGAP